jgi:hypothetical protein
VWFTEQSFVVAYVVVIVFVFMLPLGMCESRPPLAIHRLALVSWLDLPWLHCLVCPALSLCIASPRLAFFCLGCIALAVPYLALTRMAPCLVLGLGLVYSVRVTVTVREHFFFSGLDGMQ